jgi:hypothetical protein
MRNATVPEPGLTLLAGIGVLSVAARASRRRRQRPS